MGFFITQAPEEIKKPARAPKAAKGFDENLRGCDNCQLRANWSWITSARMELSGNLRDPDILILGEAPDEEDDKKGIPYIGEAGRLIRRAIPGRELDRIAYGHVVRCRIRNDDPPPAQALHACSIHLEDDLAKLGTIRLVIGIGQAPLNRFFPGTSIARIHGLPFPIQVGERVIWYCPILAPSYIKATGGDRSPALPHLKSDIKRAIAEFERWGKPRMFRPDPDDVLYPQSISEAYEILRAMQGPIAVDIETTGLRFARKGAKILTAALSDGDITAAWAIDHPEAPTDWGMQFLLEFVRDNKWIAHNSAFELAWILHARNLAGLDFEPAPFEDSMAIGRALHERTTMLGLDVMSRMHLGIDFKALVKVNRNNMINEPLERILPYNGLDAQASALLWRTQRKKVHEETYLRLLESIRSMAEMELMGLDVDAQANIDLKEYWTLKLQEAQEQSKTIYEVRQFELTKQIEFNIGSNDHVAEALVEFGKVTLPKTRQGKGEKWSTDDQDLRTAAPDNPLVKIVLEYREASKTISTYIDPVRDAIENNFDGRLHPAYTCMLTATTRPSCVSGETLLHTTRGTFRFDEYLPQADDHVVTHTGKLCRVLSKIYKGIAPQFKIMLSNGSELTCAPSHRVLTSRGWKRLSDLSLGSEVYSYERGTNIPSPGEYKAHSGNVSERREADTTAGGRSISDQDRYNIPCASNNVARGSVSSREENPLLQEQAGRKEPYAGQIWRATSPLCGRAIGRPWLPDQASGRSGILCSQACVCRSARDTYSGATGLSGSASYRREPAEQSSGQSGAGHSARPPEVAFYEKATITEISSAGERGVWDIEVEGDHSYLSSGFISHNSESPNIQNFPKRRHRELRLQVVAPPGHIIASFDAGQIEARGFGMATKDKNLCESIIKKIDIHSKWRDRALEIHPPYIERLAEKTNETDMKKILKGGRDIIKTDFVFSSFFGSTAKSCSNRTGLPLEVTEKLLAEFWREYPAVGAWVKAKRREYDETGTSRLLTGLARHEIMKGNEPLNNPIQGSTTGQMVLEAQNAMSRHARRLKDPYLHPRINIHDDLTFILPDSDPDVLETYIDFIGNELCAVRFPFQIVPLMWECKVGYNWSDFEEIAVFVGDYIR